jgi:hypothetical protein
MVSKSSRNAEVDIAGITVHPDEPWMKQIARNATMEDCGALRDCRYLLHDRDAKFTRSFRAIIVSGRVEPLALPARSPNLNAYRINRHFINRAKRDAQLDARIVNLARMYYLQERLDHIVGCRPLQRGHHDRGAAAAGFFDPSPSRTARRNVNRPTASP